MQLIREWNRKSEAISLISKKLNDILDKQQENKIITETLKFDLLYSKSLNESGNFKNITFRGSSENTWDALFYNHLKF